MKFALTTLQVNMSHAAHRALRSSLPCLLFLWHVVFWCLTLKLGGIGLFFMSSESAISSLHCLFQKLARSLISQHCAHQCPHSDICFCHHVWIYSPQASCLDSRFTGIRKYAYLIISPSRVLCHVSDIFRLYTVTSAYVGTVFRIYIYTYTHDNRIPL